MDRDKSAHTAALGDVLTVLEDEYSRDVLSYFCDSSSDVASLDQLANHVHTETHGVEERVAVRLHHLTLPRLEEDGVIEYDTRSKTARYRGGPELESLLDDVR